MKPEPEGILHHVGDGADVRQLPRLEHVIDAVPVNLVEPEGDLLAVTVQRRVRPRCMP